MSYTDKLQSLVASASSPDEAFLAGVQVVPKGGIKRAAVGSIGGVIGAAIATSVARNPVGEIPLSQSMGLGLSDRQLFIVKNSAMTGGAKEIVARFPLDQVASVSGAAGKMVGMKMVAIDIVFGDGTAVSFEAPRVRIADAEQFLAAIEPRLHRAA